MTESEWYPTAGIEAVSAEFTPDGELRESATIDVKVFFNECKDHLYDPDEVREDGDDPSDDPFQKGEVVDTEYRGGAYARLRYDVEDGVARLSKFKDATPEDAGWISVEFLKTAMAAQYVVGNVPGVDSVEDAPQTLGRHLREGDEAEIYRA